MKLLVIALVSLSSVIGMADSFPEYRKVTRLELGHRFSEGVLLVRETVGGVPRFRVSRYLGTTEYESRLVTRDVLIRFEESLARAFPQKGTAPGNCELKLVKVIEVNAHLVDSAVLCVSTLDKVRGASLARWYAQVENLF